MITQAMCSSFKYEMFVATHNFATDTFMIALYTSAADINADTTVYTSTGEVVGTGYVAGGAVLTGTTITLTGTTAYVDFADPSWAAASLTVRGALIYNASKSNKAVAVLDFGADKIVANNTLTIEMPANTASTAIVRYQ